MRLIRTLLLLLPVAVFATGCAMNAPHYTPSVDNVQLLKKGGTSMVKVGGFSAIKSDGNANPISIRGSSLNSPYNASYADYLGEALKQELLMANRMAAASDVEIGGELLKNDIDASGFSVGKGNMSARFTVKKAGMVRYDQVKTVQSEWESSFVGAVAIPKAVQEYSNMVGKLLAQLYSDSAFVEASK